MHTRADLRGVYGPGETSCLRDPEESHFWTSESTLRLSGPQMKLNADPPRERLLYRVVRIKVPVSDPDKIKDYTFGLFIYKKNVCCSLQ